MSRIFKSWGFQGAEIDTWIYGNVGTYYVATRKISIAMVTIDANLRLALRYTH